MRVLILSQWCYPEPDLKALTFARELQKKGHSVQILTGFPNYPGGKLYEGYKVKWSQREVIENVEIIRVPLYPSHDQSGGKRMLNYLSFAFSAALLGVFRVKKADVMYVYHPPATIGIPAVFIRFFRRIPVVYDIQDMWPDTLTATGMVKNKIVLKLISWYCAFIYGIVDRITVLSHGFKNRLVSRGVDAAKIDVIYNWPNPFTLPEIQDKSRIPAAAEKFTILFAGTMGRAQALDKVLDAAAILKAEGASNIQFAFLGGGICLDELKAQKERLRLDNVVFLPRVNNSDVGTYLAAADALLVHLKDDELFKITIPSKTQAYFQAGKPVLMAVGGDADAMINDAGAGVCCPPEDAEAMAAAAIKLSRLSEQQLADMGTNARSYFDKYLAIDHGVSQFEKAFETTVNV
ncbi:glycosyltransferase family 4 protein [Polluticoccus soli]|uniref:glycosyltransferase family 4 protein n=1 Tax=Polluticoccus soli TaxID=3034150 RepID=UPI0023E18E8A|nr:glycosyltransferase family 4 protein [Flavipsychrobacter sp. JY13-12]